MTTSQAAAESSWADTVRQKISELETVSSWAGQTGFSTVRDHCRKCASELRNHLDVRKRLFPPEEKP